MAASRNDCLATTTSPTALCNTYRIHSPFVPFGDAPIMEVGLQRLLAKKESIQEEVVKLAVADPRTVTILLRFCVRPRLTLWMRALPLHLRGRRVDLNDKRSQRTAERLVHGFDQRSPPARLSHSQSQISLPTRLGSLGLAHSSRIQHLTAVSVWADTISTLIPLGEETLDPSRPTVINTSTVYGSLPGRTGQHHLSRGRNHVFVGGSTPWSSPPLETSHGRAPIPKKSTWEATEKVPDHVRKARA